MECAEDMFWGEKLKDFITWSYSVWRRAKKLCQEENWIICTRGIERICGVCTLNKPKSLLG